ncbi:hypothetical protein GSI_07217 [Ganoderma sinense ZZ0214-1]|uniref:Fe2OG dioxygenase domain-containing protein n=1 Tax=Ganoderma sinense ZZ0214-1 TaxID=1077348 RepID=A0A2G8S9V1_9APHY|nr:hypothetical protein GSI_07217 [Ganoderma sinense ZZ0214-1]
MTVTAQTTTTLGDMHDPTSAAYKKARRKHWKSTRNRSEHADADWTPFRAAEKRYKARFPPPDLSDVLDLALADPFRASEAARGGWKGCANAVECREILLHGSEEECGRKAYIFPGTPGLVLLPSFVPHHEQRRLVRWALRDHARDPNETNLDTHYLLPQDGLWSRYLRIRTGVCEDTDVLPRASQDVDPLPTPMTSEAEAPGPRKLIANDPASADNYQTLANTPKPPAPPSQSLHPAPVSSLVPKLRWANIGWYYHWGTKQYDFSRGPGEISSLVTVVCKRAVGRIPWEQVFGDTTGNEADWGPAGPDWTEWKETYEPDAGIVNFYQTKDTLMAHVDRSEICATSPLVSISLGCAAVFLIGGLTRDESPTPILLRSGDIVIMSGPACRRAYHGVPRILEGTLPPHLEGPDAIPSSPDEDDWGVYEEYLRGARINVNVRQVFPKGFDPILDGNETS